MVETYSQEIGLELDGPGQVWQGGFGFSHCQEDCSSLVEGQVVLRISLCEAQKLVTLTFLRVCQCKNGWSLGAETQMSVCEPVSSYPQQSGSVTRLQPAAQQPRVCGPSPNGAQSQPGWPPRPLKHDTEPRVVSTTVDIRMSIDLGFNDDEQI